MQAVFKTMGVEPVDEKTAINIASSHKRIPKEDTPLAWSDRPSLKDATSVRGCAKS